MGQGQMPKNCFLHHCYLALRSRSKVEVKVMGQDQGQISVDIRGSALPSAAEIHYQSKVFVCVSVIWGIYG